MIIPCFLNMYHDSALILFDKHLEYHSTGIRIHNIVRYHIVYLMILVNITFLTIVKCLHFDSKTLKCNALKC